MLSNLEIYSYTSNETQNKRLDKQKKKKNFVPEFNSCQDINRIDLLEYSCQELIDIRNFFCNVTINAQE